MFPRQYHGLDCRLLRGPLMLYSLAKFEDTNGLYF